MSPGRNQPPSPSVAFGPALLDALGHAVIVTARDGTVLVWNREAERLYGWSAVEAVGRNVVGLTVGPDALAAAVLIVQHVLDGEVWTGDYPAQRNDGSVVVVHVTNTPLLGEDGDVTAIVGVSFDVTERRRREDALHRDEERARVTLEAGRMGTWSWDLATGSVTWDEAMETLYGMAPGSFTGEFEEYANRIHPDDRDWVAHQIATARSEGRGVEFEHRLEWPDGSVHWIESRGRAVHDDDGNLIGMVGVGIDIDDRKQLEALMRVEAELRAVAALARDLEDAERIARLGSWHWDAETDVVKLSHEMALMLGTKTAMNGAEFRAALRNVAHPDDADELERIPTQAVGTKQQRFMTEWRLVRGDEIRIVVHRGEIIVDDDGTLSAVRGTAQDVTEQRHAAAELLEATNRLAKERRAVQVLQETLIRPEFPALTGFDFAARYLAAEDGTEIGGDWYDVFQTPDGHVILAVGDVSGHGVASARLMAKLRHATRAYLCLETDLPLVLTSLDQFVRQFAVEDQMATTLLGRLNTRTGHVEIASAGHPPPLHLTESTSTFLSVKPGPPLGAHGDAEQLRDHFGDARDQRNPPPLHRRARRTTHRKHRHRTRTPPRIHSRHRSSRPRRTLRPRHRHKPRAGRTIRRHLRPRHPTSQRRDPERCG